MVTSARDKKKERDKVKREKYAEDALPPGSKIAGKYVVEKQLGRGGMGVVVVAHHDVPEGWVRLARSGDTVTAWSSVDGSEWTQIGEPQLLPGLSEMVLAGAVAVGRDREIERSRTCPTSHSGRSFPS